MRESKFRCWHTKGAAKMITEIIGSKDGFITGIDSSDILMQYTGLKDKNGKEIYEGDILKHGISDYEPFANSISVVEWFEENFMYIVQKKHIIKDEEDKKVFDTMELGNVGGGVNSECEVIGNIYENPELLN